MSKAPIPQCIGIIMDGNRRFAKEENKDPWEGHRAGAETLKTVVSAAQEKGIRHLIFYTLSTENWKRDPKEVEFLLALLKEFFTAYLPEAIEKGTRIRIAGQKERFPEDVQAVFSDAEERTKNAASLTVWFALSYGGRAEILQAVNALVRAGVEEVSEEMFEARLWTAGMPDPDLIIRTGGEIRLSNFLPWQSVYSELFFTDTYWPAFTKDEFHSILEAYASRARRFGR